MNALKGILERILEGILTLPIAIAFKVLRIFFKWFLFSFFKTFEVIR